MELVTGLQYGLIIIGVAVFFGAIATAITELNQPNRRANAWRLIWVLIASSHVSVGLAFYIETWKYDVDHRVADYEHRLRNVRTIIRQLDHNIAAKALVELRSEPGLSEQGRETLKKAELRLCYEIRTADVWLKRYGPNRCDEAVSYYKTDQIQP